MLSRENKKSNPLTQSQSMSIEKQKPQIFKSSPSTALSTIFKPIHSSGQLTKSSTVQQCVAVGLGTDPVFDVTDPTVMLRYPVINMTSSQKKRILQISFMGNTIVQYAGQDFLPKYGLMVENVTGFTQSRWDGTNWVNQVTNVVAYSYPTTVHSFVKDNSGIVHYNLVYQLPAGTSWEIGNLTQLVFKVVDDKGVPVAGPFNSIIQLQFRILHVGM